MDSSAGEIALNATKGVGSQRRPSGVMDSASDFGSEGCGFKSHLGRSFLLKTIPLYLLKSASLIINPFRTQSKLILYKLLVQKSHYYSLQLFSDILC